MQTHTNYTLQAHTHIYTHAHMHTHTHAHAHTPWTAWLLTVLGWPQNH